MASDLDPQQVEIIGRHWFIGELVRADLEAADPLRDNGIDLLVSAADYSWTQPIQIKTSRDRNINVYPQYVRGRFPQLPLLMVYTLLGDSQAPMPAEAGEAVFLRSYNDYSPRLLVLTPAEAWALPTISGKSDANPGSDYPHRLSWTSLVRNGHLPADAVVEHRGQLLMALRAGRQRRHAEMTAQSVRARARGRCLARLCPPAAGAAGGGAVHRPGRVRGPRGRSGGAAALAPAGWARPGRHRRRARGPGPAAR